MILCGTRSGLLVHLEIFLSFSSADANTPPSLRLHPIQLFSSFYQCDQIGQFLKVLVNKFALKGGLKLLLTFWLFFKMIN